MRFRSGSALVALVAVLAMSALMAGQALAASTNNPAWNVEGKQLGAGLTKDFTASANGEQTLTMGGASIECKKLSTTGVLTGSATSAAGTGEGVSVYKECAAPGDETKCVINGDPIGKGEIKSDPLSLRLVYLTQAAAEAEALTTEATGLFVQAKSGEVMMEYTLSGTCPMGIGKFRVEGGESPRHGLVMKVLGDDVSQASHEAEDPDVMITKYWENVGGKSKEVPAHLEQDGSNMTMYGASTFGLTSKESWNTVI
jgi:hypothetical protein